MTMTRRTRLPIRGLALTFALPLSVVGLEIDLPQETALLRPSPLPGFNLVRQNCIACHSVDYIVSQPPNSTRAYWGHTVAKMKTAFGAPIQDADIPRMIDYLVTNYGAERDSDPTR